MWVRNMYTGSNGGIYTGPDAESYMANYPSWHIFAKELRKIGMDHEATIIENALREIGYRI